MEQDDRQARIIPFPVKKKPSKRYRKFDLNRNKEGSVRKMYGKVYVDFMYLGERVRESSGLPWNRENAREVRDQLDRIVVAVKAGTFRFAEVFPESIKREYFADKERLLFGEDRTPEEVLCKDYISEWYVLLKNSGRVTERTLWGYKSHIDLYLQPFFGKLTFAALNANTFDRFIAWARKQRYRKKSVSNATLNKCLSLLKGICKSAAIEYGWGAGLEVRDMKQTRHSFATVGLSCGENPLWIAKVMGHRNTEMIIKVYGKYIENAGVSKDGTSLNQLYQEGKSNSE